ncbi:MAG: 50S ribosomal protein L21 [Proteobacteria bacterium]|nr:50S ribosomal protein L21 [Pseudomonadota bacterium]
MFAVIKTGGKQYKVAEDDTIFVETLAGDPGSTVKINDVLLIGGPGMEPQVEALDKAAVFAEVVEQTRGAKIIVFKKKRRKNYRRKAGHRQNLTLLRITGISATGTKPAQKPAQAKKGTKKGTSRPETEKKAKGAPKKPAAKTSAEPAAKAKQGPKKPAAKKPAAKKKSKE